MSGGTGARLTTWVEVHAHLAATYGGTTTVGDGVLGLMVSEIPIDVRIVDEGWIKLTFVIGSMRLLSVAEQLARNVREVIGTFCSHDGQLAIRQTLPLGELHPADLDETMRALVQLAAAARKRTLELA